MAYKYQQPIIPRITLICGYSRLMIDGCSIQVQMNMISCLEVALTTLLQMELCSWQISTLIFHYTKQTRVRGAVNQNFKVGLLIE